MRNGKISRLGFLILAAVTALGSGCSTRRLNNNVATFGPNGASKISYDNKAKNYLNMTLSLVNLEDNPDEDTKKAKQSELAILDAADSKWGNCDGHVDTEEAKRLYAGINKAWKRQCRESYAERSTFKDILKGDRKGF